MERLPNETLDNAIKVYELTLEATKGMSEDELDDYNPVLDKVIINFLKELKAYRRTGLTPEQILAMDEEYTKLAKELGEYKRLEEQGRLIKIPVPCGGWVYSAECGIVVPDIVASYTKDNYGLWCLNQHGGLIGLWGKSVFPTHVEAEKALAEMGGGRKS